MRFHKPSIEALLEAIVKNSTQEVESLVKQKQLNDKFNNNFINEKDIFGRTPLYAACENDEEEKIKWLLDKKANVNEQDRDGRTPLHWVCWRRKNIELVKLFLDNGAEVNRADNNGITPLHVVCFRGDIEIVNLLLDNGAEINIEDSRGETPLYCAFGAGYMTGNIKGSMKNRVGNDPVKGSFLNATIDNISIEFEEHVVESDGDCGFTALGTDRKTLGAQLRLLKDDINSREILAGEIANAFITYATTNGKEGLKPNDAGTSQLLNIRNNERNALDTLFRKTRDELGNEEVKQLELNALIDWLNKNNRLDDANALLKQDLKVFQANDKINIHCKKNEVFDYYLTQMENTKLWLGYKSILLYAKQTNKTVYIWRKDNTHPNQLALIDSHKGNTAEEIHMLHTGSFTHFILLSKPFGSSQSHIKIANLLISKGAIIDEKITVLKNFRSFVSNIKASDEIPKCFVLSNKKVKREFAQMIAGNGAFKNIELLTVKKIEEKKNTQKFLETLLSDKIERFQKKHDEYFDKNQQEKINQLKESLQDTIEKSQKEQEKKLSNEQQKKIDSLREELQKRIDESQKELNEQFSSEQNTEIKNLQEWFQEEQDNKTKEIGKFIEEVQITSEKEREELRNRLQEFRQSLAKNFMNQLFLLCDEFENELKRSQNNNNENNQGKIEEAKERLNQRIHLAALILEKNLLETNSTLAKVTKNQKEGFELLSPVLQKFLEQEAEEKKIQALKQHPKQWAYYINCRRGLESKLFATESLSSGMVSRPDSKTEKGQKLATGIFNGFLEIFDVFGAAVITNIIQFAADETTSAAKDYFENKKIKRAEENFEYFEAAIWMIKYTSMHLTNSYSSAIDTQENEKEAGKAGTKSAKIIYDHIKENIILGVSPEEKADYLFGVVEKEANTGKTSLFSTKAQGKVFKSGAVKPNRTVLLSPASKNQLVRLTKDTDDIYKELTTKITQNSNQTNQVRLQLESQNKQLENLKEENEELKKKIKKLEEKQEKEINDLKLLVQELIKQQKGQQPVNQNTIPSQGGLFK